MIKAIIFDFDGVIVESVEIKTTAFAKLFKSEDEDIVKKIIEYHLKNTGVSRFEKFRYIYKEILRKELKDRVFRKLCQRFSELVVDEVVNASYVKGAMEFLKLYSQQYKCFVISATPQDELERILKRRGINHYFIAIFGAPEKKDNTTKKIIDTYNLLPKEVIYIGDALSDYKAANLNSVNFIARINSNHNIFKEINCLKTKDLTALKSLIETL